MSNMKVTGETSTVDAHKLAAYVDRWVGYVAARVRPNDVDDVLQTVRETVLSRAAHYDPALGEPGAWVFGIVRVTVRAARRGEAVEYARTGGHEVGDTIPAAGADAGDPLAFLVEHRDVVEWARLVAAAATPFEWRVIVTFAKTEGTSADVAKELGTQPSTVRAARARVAALTRTAMTALMARDDDAPVTLERCVPADGGYADLLPYRSADEGDSADALGISRPAFRTRRAMLRRLEMLLHEVSPTAVRAA